MQSRVSIGTRRSKTEIREMLGKRIATARYQAELSVSDVSERIGVSRLTYVRYESGGSEPGISTLLDIAAVTRSSVLWLILGDDIQHQINLFQGAEHGE